MVAIKRRLVNPEKKLGSPRAARSHPKKANPGLILLGTVNPERKAMQKAAKQKNKPARKSNPFPFFGKKTKAAGLQKAYKPKKIRRRNPEALDMVKEPINVLKFGMVALLGMLATRQVPQWLLKANNTGWKGYLANLATATAGGIGTTKFAGKQNGSAVMIGGGLYLVNRIISEQLSPIGTMLALSGVGDPAASSARPALGKLQQAYFAHPVRRDKAGNPIIPQEILQAAAAAAAAAAPSKVSGLAASRLTRGRLAA